MSDQRWMMQSATGPEVRWEDVRIDTSKPSIARVYDAVLQGKDNFAVDREIADRFLTIPGGTQIPGDNRAWLGRVTRWLVAEAGIRQIIDLGSGLPTASNIHDHAQEVAPETRVAYVDNDPIVLAHGRAILGKNDNTTVITADVTDPGSVFEHPDLTALIDLDQPYAIILAAVLHHIPVPDNQKVAAAIREHVAPGCYFATANFHDPGDPMAREIETILVDSDLGSGWFRPYPQHRMYFDGLELVRPGLCPVNEWHPDEQTPTDSAVHHLYIGGVGHRPA